jgi:hypothetical protein
MRARHGGKGVSEQSYYRWRREYGGLKVAQARRLRYADTPAFLDVTSVISQYELDRGIAADASFSSGSDLLSLGGDARYIERPTITFAPLKGPNLWARNHWHSVSMDTLTLPVTRADPGSAACLMDRPRGT